MQVDIQYRPSNTVAKIGFEKGETCTTEAGAMIAMSPNLQIETSTHKKGKGGILKAVKRMFAGESFFMNHYTAHGNAELWLAPTLSGDINTVELNKNKIIVQAGSYLASEQGINVDVGWQGFKSAFSGEGLFWLSISGQGKVVLSSYGCIYPVQVTDTYVVDTGHIVAFEETLDFSISKAGSSWVQSFLGGEGLVCLFKGKGIVWCQSHNPSSFGHSLTSSLRPKKR